VKFVENLAAVAIIGACLAVLAPVFIAPSATAQTGQDRIGASVSNARRIVQALAGYSQDYDGVFPSYASQAEFEEKVGPYAGGVASLRKLMKSPAARNAVFTLNLSGLTPDENGLIEVLRDSASPIDGKLLIAYLDGYVTRGGVDVDWLTPENTSLAYGKQLGFGMIAYAQDYDETLPPLSDVVEFEALLFPYLRSHRFFHLPPSGSPWVLNSAFSGIPLAFIFDPASTELARDPIVRSDGKITVVYADGHAVRQLP
jgi:hypothetical protein